MKKITAIVLVFIFVITIFSGCGQKAPTVEELLSLGERYLTELDYEKALVTFSKVIEIEPMNADGYLGAAEAHLGNGNAEQAVAILELGLEKTGDQRIRNALGVLESVDSSSGNNMRLDGTSMTDDIIGSGFNFAKSEKYIFYHTTEGNNDFTIMRLDLATGEKIDLTTINIMPYKSPMYTVGDKVYFSGQSKDYDGAGVYSMSFEGDNIELIVPTISAEILTIYQGIILLQSQYSMDDKFMREIYQSDINGDDFKEVKGNAAMYPHPDVMSSDDSVASSWITGVGEGYVYYDTFMSGDIDDTNRTWRVPLLDLATDGELVIDATEYLNTPGVTLHYIYRGAYGINKNILYYFETESSRVEEGIGEGGGTHLYRMDMANGIKTSFWYQEYLVQDGYTDEYFFENDYVHFQGSVSGGVLHIEDDNVYVTYSRGSDSTIKLGKITNGEISDITPLSGLWDYVGAYLNDGMFYYLTRENEERLCELYVVNLATGETSLLVDDLAIG